MTKIFVNDLKKRKSKTVIIFLSFLFMSFLLYIAFAIQAQIVNVQINYELKMYQQIDAVLIPQKIDQLLSEQEIDMQDFEKINPFVGMSGYFVDEDDMNVIVSIKGINLEQSNKFNNEQIKYRDYNEQNYCYMSKETALKYGFELGDSIEFIILGKSYSFILNGYGENGLFDNSSNPYIAINVEEARNILGIGEDTYTGAYVKMKDSSNVSEIVSQINNNDELNYKIQQVVDKETLESEAYNTTIPIIFITILAVVMGMMLVNANYKIVLLERQVFLGTLKSIGMTQGNIRMDLFLEMLLVSLLACIPGLIGGIFATTTLARIMIQSIGIDSELVFSPNIKAIILTCIVIIIIMFFIIGSSSRKLTKKSLRELLFSTKTIEQYSYRVDVIYIIFALISWVLLLVGPSSLYIFEFIILVVMILLLVPLLVKTINRLLSIFFYKFSMGASFTVTKEMFALKPLQINGIMVVLCIVIGVGTSAISSVFGTMLEEAYDTFNTDIFIENISTDTYEELVSEIDEDERIDSYYEYFSTSGSIDEVQISSIQGVDTKVFKSFNNFYSINQKYYEKLGGKNYILLSNSVLAELNKEIGDIVQIEIDGISDKYIILGEFNPHGDAMGSVALIDKDNYVNSFDISSPKFICAILNDNSNESITTLKKDYTSYLVTILSKSDKQGEQFDMVNSILTVVNLFCYLVMFVAAIGLFGNLYICESQKQGLKATYTTLGISKKVQFFYDILQNFIFVLCTGTIAAVESLITLWSLNKVMVSLNYDYKMPFNYSLFATLIATLFIILVIIKLLIRRSYRNRNIINILKCD